MDDTVKGEHLRGRKGQKLLARVEKTLISILFLYFALHSLVDGPFSILFYLLVNFATALMN